MCVCVFVCILLSYSCGLQIEDVIEVIKLLQPNTEVVSAGEFVQRIVQNVPH